MTDFVLRWLLAGYAAFWIPEAAGAYLTPQGTYTSSAPEILREEQFPLVISCSGVDDGWLLDAAIERARYIRILPGLCIVRRPITLRSHQSLRGSGSGETRIVSRWADSILYLPRGVEGVRIGYLTFDGGRP